MNAAVCQLFQLPCAQSSPLLCVRDSLCTCCETFFWKLAYFFGMSWFVFLRNALTAVAILDAPRLEAFEVIAAKVICKSPQFM